MFLLPHEFVFSYLLLSLLFLLFSLSSFISAK